MQIILSQQRHTGPWAKLVSILRPVLLLLSPLVIALTCQTVTLQSFPEALGWLFSHPSAAGVTWLILLLAELVLFGLTRLLSLSYLIAAMFPFVLTLVSYYKSIINGEPLMISDLALARNLFQVAGFAAGRITISFPTGLAITVLLLLLAGLVALDVLSLLGWDLLRPTWNAGLCGAGGGLLILLILLAVLKPFGVSLYENNPAPAARDRTCSVPLSLLSAWYASQATASHEYSPERMADILTEMEDALQSQTTADIKPHIIFVMNESFFDITQIPGLTFSEDPLSNYHRLQSDSTYGSFYTCTSGGGTGWVEMEAFTGSTLSNTLTEEQYDALPSYVRVLKDNGYHTVAFHSHTDELYNRRENYPHLGFDEVLFVDDYEGQGTYAGGYFDDSSTADVLISLFEEHRDNPTYLYAMTMQNHQPYYAGRYDPERLEVTSTMLSDTDLEMVTCYTSGAYDADQMLGRLVDYFSLVEEPVILVFAGDHRPSLSNGDGNSVYANLELIPTASGGGWSTEDYRTMFATNYMIWSNYLPGGGEQPNSTMTIGATILAQAQLPATPYFAWLNQARQTTVLYQRLVMTIGPDGQLIWENDPDVSAFLSARKDVLYDLLYGKGYLSGKLGTSISPESQTGD